LIAGYRIVRELGRGGMATVYLAVQESLGREVALKVMNPALAADAGFVERFLREARLMASFRHRALVPVFEAGRSGEVLFLAMEYLPGGNAGDLRGGDPEEIRRCLLDVALGLAYIHARGVVHRDLKPENILRREDGSYVLSDFGIARSQLQSRELTAPHSAIGTPSYMSPEQWRGEAVDAGADLYSLGIVVFELLTGRTPFNGEDGWAIGMQHMQAPRPSLPAELAEWQPLLDRLLAVERTRRPAVAAEVVALLGGKPETTPAPARTPPPGEATEPTPLPRKGRLRAAVVLGVLLLVAAGAVALRGWQAPAPPAASAAHSIDALAVLPLVNVSGDPAQDYFVDGLSDELINQMAEIEGLRVISRTSSMLLKGSQLTLPEIARQLSVDVLVEGSVLRAGERVQINVKLIDAHTDTHLWQDSYERPLDDVLVLQREVGGAVARAIQRRIRSDAGLAPLTGEALEELLRGRDLTHQAINASGTREAQPLFDSASAHFERALQLQAGHPTLLAGLATLRHWQAGNIALSRAERQALFAQSRQLAEQALASDPDNVQALNALGFVQFQGFNDWRAAGASYVRCKAVRSDACSLFRTRAVPVADRRARARLGGDPAGRAPGAAAAAAQALAGRGAVQRAPLSGGDRAVRAPARCGRRSLRGQRHAGARLCAEWARRRHAGLPGKPAAQGVATRFRRPRPRRSLAPGAARRNRESARTGRACPAAAVPGLGARLPAPAGGRRAAGARRPGGCARLPAGGRRRGLGSAQVPERQSGVRRAARLSRVPGAGAAHRAGAGTRAVISGATPRTSGAAVGARWQRALEAGVLAQNHGLDVAADRTASPRRQSLPPTPLPGRMEGLDAIRSAEPVDLSDRQLRTMPASRWRGRRLRRPLRTLRRVAHSRNRPRKPRAAQWDSAPLW